MRTTNRAEPLLAGGPDIVEVRRRSCGVYAGVMLSLLALAAAPTHAASDIHSFVDCVNSLANPTVVDAVACVPDNCATTVTMSEESAQPACTLRDGTALPRVIFSCAIPNSRPTPSKPPLGFRPAFTLCTQAGVINHIELGEDVNKGTRTDDPDLRNFPYLQKMADVDMTKSAFTFTEFGTGPTAVLDAKSPANSKDCVECHDKLGTSTVSMTPLYIANLFLPVPPAVVEGTIFSNDPAVEQPASQANLNDICYAIAHSNQLANSRIPGLRDLATNLCVALVLKTH